MLRAMAAVIFVEQRCIPHWNRVHTLVAQDHVQTQSFLQVLRVLLLQLQTLIHRLLELVLMHCVPQELKLLLMFWQMKCRRS
jgi:hypothetical protein